MLHGLCWILLFTLPYLLRPSFTSPRELLQQNKQNLSYLTNINHVIWIALFYVNAYIIVPQVIYKKRFEKYVLVLLAILSILFLIDWTLFYFLIDGLAYSIKNFFWFNFFPILFILACSTAFRMVNDRIQGDRLQKEKENENLKTELSLLRSQVSPHFMFNIMNNMVALARKKSDLLEPSLIKLSSLLRYMLYETDEKVALQKEIEYLQSYIDLQKQRFGNNVTIKTCMEKVNENYEIEPMLLIPFVENAIKHGISKQIKGGVVKITSDLKGNYHELSVQNTGYLNGGASKSGFGLSSTQDRLNLLYGNKAKFEIKQIDSSLVEAKILIPISLN